MLRRCLLLAKNMMVSTRRYVGEGAAVPVPVVDASHRVPPPCSSPPYVGAPTKPCFDVTNVMVESAQDQYDHLIKPFLYTEFFPREPCFVGLSLQDPVGNPYMEFLYELYTTGGDKWFAFGTEPRTGERLLVGFLVCKKRLPWEAPQCKRFADCFDGPQRVHMHLRAHCFESPNIFNAFPFVYNVEAIVTKEEVGGHGVASLLLAAAILHALEMRYPAVQVISTNAHMDKICKRFNMKPMWSMKYSQYVDYKGRTLLYTRDPHQAVNVFTRSRQPGESSIPDKLYHPALYNYLQQKVQDKVYCLEPKRDLYPALPPCPTLKKSW